ncbi:MAG: DUF1194 domain-containing protein [Rubrimonas sp.]
MRAAAKLGAAAGAALLALAAPARAFFDCAAALVLAMDVSSSVDAREHDLQVRGLADALRNEEVIDTILAEGGVMAAAFQWSGWRHQAIMADWTPLIDRASILAFADAVEAAPRAFTRWPTGLGQALGFAAEMHMQNPVTCRRRIVDVSGDGVNNDGPVPAFFRLRGALDGLTINGLVIRGATPDPEPHYREQVIQGPGSFVIAVESYDDYPPAILRKLLRELQPPFAAMD